MHIKSKDINMDNSSKKIVIGMKILNLNAYFFFYQYVMKSLKQIMILWFTPESDVEEPKYIYLQVE